MNRIQGKVVVITGATSGIGEACARAFAGRGAELVLLARRTERLAALADELRSEHGVAVRTFGLDVRDREGVIAFGRQLEAEGVTPDVLVNNAGLGRGLEKLHEGRFEDWDEMIDTNIKGLLNVTRVILPMMVRRDRGHVVNIGSTAGHMVYPGGNVYNATKFAVRALNEAMNVDLLGTRIRVSSIDPGMVETEFSKVRFRGDEERAAAVYRGFKPLTAEDIADAVVYVVNAPEHVNVLDMVILPTAQRNVYLVDRSAQ
ncbi:MAG TPA: SDR family NAD(P)-dependent oxidoreductase [Longimicrobiales bacterium]